MRNVCSHGEAGVTVHFNVHMDPAKGKTKPEEIYEVILSEILLAADNSTDSAAANNLVDKSTVLSDIVIDEQSLEVEGKCKVWHTLRYLVY